MEDRDIAEAVERILKDWEALKHLRFGDFNEVADFAAIGQLAVYFNFLDQGLLYLAIDLFGFRLPRIGRELLQTWTVDAKTDAIKKAMAYYQSLGVFDDEETQSAMVLINDIRGISRDRNKWIHGFISESSTESGKYALRHPKWMEPLTLDWKDIFPVIDRILSASKRLGDLSELAKGRLRLLNDGLRRREGEAHEPEEPES